MVLLEPRSNQGPTSRARVPNSHFRVDPIALNPNPNISPLAIVLIGRLITSTLLSRILTPAMYKLIPPAIEIEQHVKFTDKKA